MQSNAISDFSGFTPDTLEFFKELEQHNTKEWFTANKDRYQEQVLLPAKQFVTAFEAGITSLYPSLTLDPRKPDYGAIMRIYRDVRFSPDKRPYKEHLGIVLPLAEGKKVEQPCFYLHVSAHESFFYAGQHQFPKEVLTAYRQAVDNDQKGTLLEELLQQYAHKGLSLMEEPHFKRVPQGYAKEHPRELLIRYTGLGIGVPLTTAELCTTELLEICKTHAATMQPLLHWLLAL